MNSSYQPMVAMRLAVTRAVVCDLLDVIERPIFNTRKPPAKEREREPSLCRREAYLWMLRRAVSHDGLLKGKYRVCATHYVPVEDGELSSTQLEMATAWNWTRQAVRCFLAELAEANEILLIKPASANGDVLRNSRVPDVIRLQRVADWLVNAKLGIHDGIDQVEQQLSAAGNTTGKTGSATGNSPEMYGAAAGESGAFSADDCNHDYNHDADQNSSSISTGWSEPLHPQEPREHPTKDIRAPACTRVAYPIRSIVVPVRPRKRRV